MRMWQVVLGAVLLTSEPAAAQQVARVDATMQALVDKGQFAGAAIVIWKDGKLVGRSATGKRDIASAAPMTPDTIVRAFSMTKPVTAVAMMILYDQGKWRPEDPVSKFIPELLAVKVFRGIGADGKPILTPPATPPTMAQLMTHTAGFKYGMDPGYVDDRYNAADIWHSNGADDFAARIARIPLAYDPGSEWRYSVSMDLQGVIVERLSGMKLPAFMKRYIFDPLNMKDTDFFVPADKMSRLATLYQWQNDKLEVATTNFLGSDPDRMPAFASGGGGLFSTADDFSSFGRMLLGRGMLDGKRIISTSSARMMMSSQLSPSIVSGRFGIGLQQIRPGYEYGYNGVVVTDPAAAKVALGKGSYLWDGLASTWFWVDPEHRIVFVGMVQRVSADGIPLVQKISQAVMRDNFYPAAAVSTVANP